MRQILTIIWLLAFSFVVGSVVASAMSERRRSGPAYMPPPAPVGSNVSTKASNQEQSQLQSVAINRVGFGIAASGGVVRCAEGANVIASEQAKGGLLVQSCLDSFASANDMQKLAEEAAKNGGFPTPEMGFDGDLIGSGKAHEIFSDLAKNYGLSREELAHRLLAARGNPDLIGQEDVLQELFKGKLSRDQIVNAMNEANKLSKEEQDKLLAESRVAGIEDEYLYKLAAAKVNIARGNRDLLKAKADRTPGSFELEGQDKSASRTGASGDTTYRFATDRVTPLEGLFSSNEEKPSEEEISIFDVVSRKIRQKTPQLVQSTSQKR